MPLIVATIVQALLALYGAYTLGGKLGTWLGTRLGNYLADQMNLPKERD